MGTCFSRLFASIYLFSLALVTFKSWPVYPESDAIAIWICISLIANDDGHFLVYLLFVCF